MTTLVRLEPRTAGPRRRRSIAILGAPNSGKTTLFNALTGHRAKAGNYPGVTVDRREGELHARFGADAVHLIDLPGIYSLTPQSEDEDVAARVLRGELGEYPPTASSLLSMRRPSTVACHCSWRPRRLICRSAWC